MDVTYQRDMNRSYMILQCDGGLDEKSFETRMIFTNKIPGLLHCHVRYEDDRTYLGYDVTSRQSLALFCENRNPGRKELRNIFGSILHTISVLDEYLLAPDHLILDSKLIMMNFDTQEASLAFAPFYKKDIRTSLKELSEYLLLFISRDDREGIVLCYRFSHELQERNSGIAELMDVLHGTDLRAEGDPDAFAVSESGSRQGLQDRCIRGFGSMDTGKGAKTVGGMDVPKKTGRRLRGTGGSRNGRDAAWREDESGSGERDAGVWEMVGFDPDSGQSLREGSIRGSLTEKEEWLWDRDTGRHGSGRTFLGRECSLAGASSRRGKSIRKMAAVLVIGFVLACAVYCGIHFLPVMFPEFGGIALRIGGAAAFCAAVVGTGIFLRKSGVKCREDEHLPSDETETFAEKDSGDEEGDVIRELEDAIEAAGVRDVDGTDAFVPDEPVMGDGMTMLLTGEDAGAATGILVPGDADSGLPLIPLSDGEVLIGKQQGFATHVISSPAVSRMHARVRRGEDGYYLRDLNSTNGTFVNDKPVYGEDEVRLEDGDRIVLADTAYFFRWDNAGRHIGLRETMSS